MAKDKYKSFVDNGGLSQVYLMRMQGAKDKEIYESLHISKQTFYTWLNTHSDFFDNYKKGKDDSIVEAIKALTSKFSVQTLTEKVTEIWETNGKQKKHIVTKVKQIPPDTTAIIFYLKSQGGWRDNYQISDTSAIAKLDELLKITQESADNEIFTETEDILPEGEA